MECAFKPGDAVCNKFCPQFKMFFIGLSVVNKGCAVLETENGNVEVNKLEAVAPYPMEKN